MLLFLLASFLSAASPSAVVPRRVRISGRHFVDSTTNASVTLAGPNVVVKGPPWLPSTGTSATAVCSDVVNDNCTASGTCSSCETFSLADVRNLQARGWNAIRLGVMWAGAQPRDEDALDADFVARLDAILSLCDAEGINVVLDNHGDMVGGAGCGNGVPMWFSQAASPGLIGKPLVTGFPYNVVPGLDIKSLPGYCGENTTAWAEFAGDPNYNLKNACCQVLNDGGNPGAIGYTTISQAAMDYLVTPGPGRDAFVRYWRLLAEAVASHPSAIAAELMNEPMTIRRTDAFDTWRAAGEAITGVIPDMSVSVSDTGEGLLLPDWLVNVTGGGGLISAPTLDWIKTSGNVFLAWHWYGLPSTPQEAVADAEALGTAWGVPTFATEFGDCSAWREFEAANVSRLYWHYSAYCTTGPSFGNRSAPEDTFGACILGWAGGNAAGPCS